MLRVLLEDESICKVLQDRFINKSTYHASRDENTRTREFVERKRMQISQAKKHRQNQSSKKLGTSIGSKLKVKNMTTPCNSGTDLKAKQHLRRAFVMEMPTSVTDATILIKVEHALVNTVALIKSALTLFYTTQELESHWYWFYSAKEQKFKYNFIEPSTFFDSTPMGKDGDACTGLYFRIINAASVIHKPEFNFNLYLKNSENKRDQWSVYSMPGHVQPVPHPTLSSWDNFDTGWV